MDKREFIGRYGEAAYVQWLEEAGIWYKSHPDGVAAYNKSWYNALLQYFETHDKKWRNKHPIEVANFSKQFQAEHLDYFASFYEQWYREHGIRGPKSLSEGGK